MGVACGAGAAFVCWWRQTVAAPPCSEPAQATWAFASGRLGILGRLVEKHGLGGGPRVVLAMFARLTGEIRRWSGRGSLGSVEGFAQLRFSSSFQGLQVERGLPGASPSAGAGDLERAADSSGSGTTSGRHLAAGMARSSHAFTPLDGSLNSSPRRYGESCRPSTLRRHLGFALSAGVATLAAAGLAGCGPTSQQQEPAEFEDAPVDNEVNEGGGKTTGDTATQGAAPQTLCPPCGTAVSGGESSEFGGDAAYALDQLELTEVALNDPALAPWVEMTEGRFELDLAWQQTILSPEVSVSTVSTPLAVDLVVTGAREHVSPDVLLLDIDVELEATDGSLTVRFPHTLRKRDQLLVSVEPFLSPGGVVAPPPAAQPGASTLELGVEGSQVLAGSLTVELAITDEGPRGRIVPTVQLRGVEPFWEPLEGRFPADGCGPLEVLVDISPDTTLRARFDQYAEGINGAGPSAAAWREGEATQVRVQLAEPTHACLGLTPVSSYAVHSALSVESEDRRVGFTHSAVVSLAAGKEESAVDAEGVRFVTPQVPLSLVETTLGRTASTTWMAVAPSFEERRAWVEDTYRSFV